MGTGYLADTNVVIDLLLNRLPDGSAQWLDRRIASKELYLSVMSRIELLAKSEPATEYELMQQFVQSVSVLPLDEPVIWETIYLRQQKLLKVPDAVIAATALVHNLIVITQDTAHFERVPGLTLLNLHNESELAVLGLLDQDPGFLL